MAKDDLPKFITKDEIKLEAMYSMMHNEWICSDWLRLVIDSLKNLDDRSRRQDVMEHPYLCTHPSCKRAGKFMSDIISNTDIMKKDWDDAR